MENTNINDATVIACGDGVDGQDEGSSGGEGLVVNRLQSLVNPPTTETLIQRESKKGISVGEQLRRLLGPSRKWVIYY